MVALLIMLSTVVIGAAIYFGQNTTSLERRPMAGPPSGAEPSGAVKSSLSAFSDDDLRDAALELVWPIAPPMSGYWGDTLERCDREQAIVDEKRKRFSTYEPVRMRREIMKWLDFSDRRIAKARDDIKSGKSVHRMREYEDLIRKKQDATSRVLQELGARKP